MDQSHQNNSFYGTSSSITSRVSPRGKNRQRGRKKLIHLYFFFFLTKLNNLHWGVSSTSKWLTEGPIYFLSRSHMLHCDEICPESAEQPLLTPLHCLCELHWAVSSSPTSKNPAHPACCLTSPLEHTRQTIGSVSFFLSFFLSFLS